MTNPINALAGAVDAISGTSRWYHYMSVAWRLTNATLWVLIGISTVSFALANLGMSTISETVAPIRAWAQRNPPEL
ncbi:MAG TPA: hypothetical protein VK473_18525 [Terriglobales bacterium]|nr:hypothetical protein [Terriglobales bacterium]